MEIRVVVADNRRARIFASHNVAINLREQEDFVHSAAHLSNQDIVDDAAGKSVDQHGSLDSKTSAKQHEEEMFAKSLGKHLKELHNKQHFDELILIAPPRFLGLLRAELPKPLDKLLTKSIDKDLTQASVEELINYIKK